MMRLPTVFESSLYFEGSPCYREFFFRLDGKDIKFRGRNENIVKLRGDGQQHPIATQRVETDFAAFRFFLTIDPFAYENEGRSI